MKDFLFKQRFNFSVVELVVFGIALRFAYQHSTFSNIILVVGLVLLIGDWAWSRYRNPYLPHQHVMKPYVFGDTTMICIAPLIRKSEGVLRLQSCPHTDVRKMRKDGSFE